MSNYYRDTLLQDENIHTQQGFINRHQIAIITLFAVAQLVLVGLMSYVTYQLVSTSSELKEFRQQINYIESTLNGTVYEVQQIYGAFLVFCKAFNLCQY